MCAADELVKRVKNPPTQKFVDMTDIVYDGLIRYDESLYTNLARILSEILSRELVQMRLWGRGLTKPASTIFATPRCGGSCAHRLKIKLAVIRIEPAAMSDGGANRGGIR
jgi:hypothetical protein